MSGHAAATADDNELPWIEELRPAPRAVDVFQRLANRPHCLFLDSARRHEKLGRYSFVAVDPYDFLLRPTGERGSLDALRAKLAGCVAPRVADLPPFQGGAAGLFGYELGGELEKLPLAAIDEFQVPALAIGLYDVVVAFDHVAGRAWIISQGFPEQEPRARRRRAEERAAAVRRWMAEPPIEPAVIFLADRLDAVALAPQFSVTDFAGLTSNFSHPAYLAAVVQAIEYIYAGDIFQVNLAQRLLYPAWDDSVSLYLRLRERNPATFAGYFDAGPWQIASASPERFLQLVEGNVEARPIKGTRRRTLHPEADLFAGDELLQSGKDRAENVMIVDLMRNDLSRVCRAESVCVTQLCELEQYEFVQHLVSAIRGTLSPDRSAIDLLAASFPGGSITGAPKVRAMEIIAELEPTARGAYCGSLGYIGFDCKMDSSILIRTITASRGWWQAPVGGGIVAQSDPEREYEETWHKAAGLIHAFF